jgi:hypothetical protein
LKLQGRTLIVDHLKASHGRNVDDFSWFNGARVAGRGNARVVSEALQAVVELAVESGFDKLQCFPATDEVARLYAKMGFVMVDGGPTRGQANMTLDLTDPNAVRLALIVFTASRANIVDVPKDVAEKIAAERGNHTAPLRHTRYAAAFASPTSAVYRMERDAPTP